MYGKPLALPFYGHISRFPFPKAPSLAPQGCRHPGGAMESRADFFSWVNHDTLPEINGPWRFLLIAKGNWAILAVGGIL